MFNIEDIKKRKDYNFECNIYKEELENETNYDEWGCAYVRLGEDLGVEYNFCIEEDEVEITNSCAIYKMQLNQKTGYMSTDTSTYEHYEIDFSDDDWKEKLENAMCEALIYFHKESLIKESIVKAMEYMSQKNCVCDYILDQNGVSVYKKDITAVDAYMHAVRMSVSGNVLCYKATNEKKAFAPIFTVVDNVVSLKGLIVCKIPKTAEEDNPRSKTIRLYLTCPQCGKSKWEKDEEGTYRCSTCQSISSLEEMSSMEEELDWNKD